MNAIYLYERNISRRSIVKSIGTGTSFSAFPGLASARKKGEIGITYDPLTGEVIGDARSTINKVENRLVGHLSLNGENINLAKFEGRINQNVDNNRNLGIKYEYTGIRDNDIGPSQSTRPTRLRITASVDRLSGMYTSAAGEKKAFIIKDKKPKRLNIQRKRDTIANANAVGSKNIKTKSYDTGSFEKVKKSYKSGKEETNLSISSSSSEIDVGPMAAMEAQWNEHEDSVTMRSVVHGYQQEVFDAPYHGVNKSIGTNRFHFQSYFPDEIEPQDRCAPEAGTGIMMVSNVQYNIRTSDSGVRFEHIHPDQEYMENHSSYSPSTSFSISVSPIPWLPLGVGMGISSPTEGGSREGGDSTENQWWDISFGGYFLPGPPTSLEETDGVEFDISLPNPSDKYSNWPQITFETQYDYAIVCYEGYHPERIYSTSPKLSSEEFLYVVDP